MERTVEQDEPTWIIQAQKGDPQAFAELVERHQRHVYNLCYRMLGNIQDAEDAAQETFLRAYRSLKRYDPNRPFSTWLLSIAAHYCIDQMRRQRRPVVSIEDLPVPDLPDPTPGLEAGLTRREGQRRIRAILEELDPIDRAAVVLFYWYDFSYEELCQTLSLTLSAVKSRLFRARRTMAMSWMESEPMPEGSLQTLQSEGGSEAWRAERIAP